VQSPRKHQTPLEHETKQLVKPNPGFLLLYIYVCTPAQEYDFSLLHEFVNSVHPFGLP